MAMALSSPHQLLHRFILRCSTPPFLRSSLASQANQSFPYLKATPYFTSFRFSHSSPAPPCSLSQQLANDVGLLENVQIEAEGETDTVSASPEGLRSSNFGVIQTPPPSLSVKEKKELASYAHSLGKKLKSQQVGKSGVTDTVVMALIETLEANELLKLKIHGTCPGELEDVVKQLEETTGSIVVGQIGRTVILYRPSLTKLKAEEKKKQAQRVYLRRQTTSKQSLQV
ncbi:hypothetical protein DH2020_029532 [Rehmannia glutinosa]|uniref:CRM domain-containing protein n=1 Tax=Rehmannia glutinosa TaxID=99300 RepID=A0ABR0VP49_REHGL